MAKTEVVRGERPFGVSLLMLLFTLTFVIQLAALIYISYFDVTALQLANLAPGLVTARLIFYALFAVSLLLNASLMYGFWKGANWTRFLAILLFAIGFVGSIYALLEYVYIPAVITLGISGFSLYYLFQRVVVEWFEPVRLSKERIVQPGDKIIQY